MFVPLSGLDIIVEDNKSVLNGASIPEANMENKHLVICYHYVREAFMVGIWKLGLVNGKKNIPCFLT